MTDPEVIIDALAAGSSVEKVAQRFLMPAPEVRKILKDEIERCLSGEHMREAWVLADKRLEAIELKFYRRAMEGDGDTTAAMVAVKTNERRATLAGANMPQSHLLQVISAPPEPKETSTERILRVIERVRAVSVPSNGSESETEPIRGHGLDTGEDNPPKDH